MNKNLSCKLLHSTELMISVICTRGSPMEGGKQKIHRICFEMIDLCLKYSLLK